MSAEAVARFERALVDMWAFRQNLTGSPMTPEQNSLYLKLINEEAEARRELVTRKDADEIAGEAVQVIGAMIGEYVDEADPQVSRAIDYFSGKWREPGQQILPFDLGPDAADRALDRYTKALADQAHFEQSFRGIRTLPLDYVQRKAALEDAVKATRLALRRLCGFDE